MRLLLGARCCSQSGDWCPVAWPNGRASLKHMGVSPGCAACARLTSWRTCHAPSPPSRNRSQRATLLWSTLGATTPASLWAAASTVMAPAFSPAHTARCAVLRGAWQCLCACWARQGCLHAAATTMCRAAAAYNCRPPGHSPHGNTPLHAPPPIASPQTLRTTHCTPTRTPLSCRAVSCALPPALRHAHG